MSLSCWRVRFPGADVREAGRGREGMQRSRKALLRRTAAAQVQSAVAEAAGNGRKRRLYGFSVSLVVTLWVAVLLLHSLVGHGDGQRGITVFPLPLYLAPAISQSVLKSQPRGCLRVGDRDTQTDAPGLSYAAKCYAADQTVRRHRSPSQFARLSYAADQTAGCHRSLSQHTPAVLCSRSDCEASSKSVTTW